MEWLHHFFISDLMPSNIAHGVYDFVAIFIGAVFIIMMAIVMILASLKYLIEFSRYRICNEKLSYQAVHDMLTGLPNRTLLLDRLTQAIVKAKRDHTKLTVIFINLDFFKFINNGLGHSVGDELLKSVTQRFKAILRASDILARIGGDEFVIVLHGPENINHITNFLERVLKEVSKPYNIHNNEVNVTCSIGFSIFPDNGNDAETLLKNAGNAMSQAKEKGKNTFQFYAGEMHTQVKKRLEIENGLRQALSNEGFILEYQPRLDIKTNHIVGFEALIRWQHPQRGVIPPDEFIPIAEDTGLILPLGTWVLETACAQNKAWQMEGLSPLCVAVNLSSRQCREKDLFEKVKKILKETDLDPQYLELELTESVAMSDPLEFIRMLSQFRNLGVKTSLDDFGTGYSSLNYLRQFPVSSLKIDQSFIRELETKEDAISIVKAIVSLGHTLNMKVIAEGVETREQLLQLEENDCDEIQGFYLSHPLPPKKAAEFLKIREKIK